MIWIKLQWGQEVQGFTRGLNQKIEARVLGMLDVLLKERIHPIKFHWVHLFEVVGIQ